VVERPRSVRKRLIVPLVLAVTTLGTVVAGAVAASSTGGCGDNGGPRVDANASDTQPDTPIV
jgi:hypothetical protein